MTSFNAAADRNDVPRMPNSRRSSEDTDEAPALVREEAVDLQRETPDRGNPSIERGDAEASDASAFEE